MPLWTIYCVLAYLSCPVVSGQWNADLTIEESKASVSSQLDINHSNRDFHFFMVTLIQVISPKKQCQFGFERFHMELPNQKNSTVLNFTFANVNLNYYCISVRPLLEDEGGNCFNRCVSRFSEVMEFTGAGRRNVSLQAADCTTWNYTYSLRVVEKKDLQLIWHHRNWTCLFGQPFEAGLFKARWNNVTNCSDQDALDMLERNPKYKGYDVSFKNLSMGSYCIRLKPSTTHSCYKNCRPIYTRTIDLSEKQDNGHDAIKLPDEGLLSSFVFYYIPIATTSVSFLLIIVLLAWKRFKVERVYSQMSVSSSEERETKPEDGKTDILVVYSRETDAHLECVKALSTFVQAQTQTEVHLDLWEEDQITERDVNWFVKRHRSCRFILVVESQGAVLRQRAHMDGQELHHKA